MVDAKEKQKFKKFKDMKDFNSYYLKHPPVGLASPEKKSKQSKEPNLDFLKERKTLKEKSIEEKLADVNISATEKKALDRVFDLMCDEKEFEKTKEKKEPIAKKDFIERKDIARILNKLGMKLTNSEIDLMIWEIDENLDNRIDRREFENMYKRCKIDKSGLEPKSLFHMIQFLMYCKKEKFTITIEDTLELLFVIVGNRLNDEIKVIFGDEEKTVDGQEKEITFAEYLDKINKKAIELRKKLKAEKSKRASSINSDE